MFQPKSLVTIAGAYLCDQDDDYKFSVKALATEKAVARRIRRNYVPSARGYAVKKRWAEDFKRVHMRAQEPIYYLSWDLAAAYVNSHPDPAQLLPRGYLQARGGADDEVSRTLGAVNKSWQLLDRTGIPQRDAPIIERRQVHGLPFETIRACMLHRQTHGLDKKAEMRCRHNAGTNQTCWRPPCGPPLPKPPAGDKNVPESLDDIFWDSD
ncbi:hypothetical protein AAVH_15419 [Aphelenchoides avenae]|nr:hypothetical protein AAVH_15419 [Aphelenchus avenae]